MGQENSPQPRWRSTTVLLVRRGAKVAMAGDGQVTLGDTVMKSAARKVRRLYNERILAGFAGASADAFSLLTRFEGKLEQYHGNLERAAIELSKEWRTDKVLRHLEALLVVADEKSSFLLSGNGDVIAPDEADGALAIGSGGAYALAAARALLAHTELGASAIAVEGLKIAADICIYSNQNIIVEEL
jgi:ATP-dependent HslUV protease subunit HslV